MELTAWISYTGIIIGLILFPGPSSLLITLHGYHYGLRRCNYTISGNTLGSFVLMSLSVLGLGLVLSSSDYIFVIVKYLAALYLIYLGVKTWRKSPVFEESNDVSSAKINNISSYGLFSQGFFTGLSNPKDLIFFAALFPVFLDISSPLPRQFLVLMSTWLIVDYSIKLIYALAGGTIAVKFSKPGVLNIFNKLIGGVFMIAGIALAGSVNVQK